MIEKIIDDNENILWRGKPNAFLYIVGDPRIYLIALIWGIFDFFFISIFLREFNLMRGFFILFFIINSSFSCMVCNFNADLQAFKLWVYRICNYRQESLHQPGSFWKRCK
ncbi:hypothetical protein [Eremococcus coleocola]|uniref:hypothetical protein n=1 Tax=Eremococcus coleocola TaxID=88132 RepID=UPI001B7FBD13|nr:hypothetical protein [Eremococcus coleocola]